jgi:hypothetical protein
MNSELRKIDQLFDEIADGNNWTGINAQHALLDISAEKAVRRLNHLHLNIAELLAHITCWNKVMTARLDNQNFQPSKEEDFPVIDHLNAEEWEDKKLEFFRTIHLLRGRLENNKDEILKEPMFEGASDAYRNLHGQVGHLHYHLGQIVLLKKLLG